jgi:hypothetical protein
VGYVIEKKGFRYYNVGMIRTAEDDDMSTSSTGEMIMSLALKHNVTYVKTPHDALADTITGLAGDSVQLDPVEKTLLALGRAGVISPNRVVPLQVNYLREKMGVRSV